MCGEVNYNQIYFYFGECPGIEDLLYDKHNFMHVIIYLIQILYSRYLVQVINQILTFLLFAKHD